MEMKLKYFYLSNMPEITNPNGYNKGTFCPVCNKVLLTSTNSFITKHLTTTRHCKSKFRFAKFLNSTGSAVTDDDMMMLDYVKSKYGKLFDVPICII